MKKRIVTFSSDYGTKDYYIGAVKGALYNEIEDLNIVDISHDIRRGDTIDASEIIGNAFKSFPEGTIHLIACETEFKEVSHIIVSYNNHLFIGIDTGIFSLMLSLEKAKSYKISNKYFKKSPFYLKEIYVPLVKALFNEHPANELGDPYTDFKILKLPVPFVSATGLRGVVKFIDSYGNLVTTIHKELFDKYVHGKRYRIATTHDMYTINEVSNSYDDVDNSSILALFNHAGYLEIAIKNGSASDLLNMDINSPLEVELI